MAEVDVAVLVGSLRRESWSRRVAHSLAAIAPAGMALTEVPIGHLQHYNEDLEAAEPAEWAAYRSRIRRADAILFVTPEYNRSVPGVLKNAVDVGSRPSRQGVLVGKPAAVVSVSPFALGAFGANHHLRQALVFLDMPTLAQPEVYLNNVATRYEGIELNRSSREFLETFLLAFEALIARDRR